MVRQRYWWCNLTRTNFLASFPYLTTWKFPFNITKKQMKFELCEQIAYLSEDGSALYKVSREVRKEEQSSNRFLLVRWVVKSTDSWSSYAVTVIIIISYVVVDEARPDPVGRFGWSLLAAAVFRSVPELLYAIHALSERSRGKKFMFISISVAFAHCSTFFYNVY